ncbi:SH3 domain-containing protein [Streptomyces sp. NPDC002896]|uniref:SH3 domain-containing protein n=1 Tax=Streptomyces sp. NPDC002896 TaxID=3154438 RepID=UPI00331AE2EF
MNRTMQRGFVAAVAALAMFPTAAVATDTAAASQQHAAHRQSVANRHVTPSQLWAPGNSTSRHAVGTGHLLGRVVTRYLPLNVRSGPGTGHRVIGSVRSGSTVRIQCKKNGSNVRGNHRWYKLAVRKGYVSARYVRNLSAVPWC